MNSKALLILSISVFLASCLGKTTENRQPEFNTDSLAKVQKLISDSIEAEKSELEEIRNLSLSAYGGTKFGMSMDEVMKTAEFLDGVTGIDFAKPPADKRTIGNHSYDITANFHNDSLYLVTIGSAWQTAAFIEFDMVGFIKNLKDVITIRYGEPHIKYRMPNVMDFEPGTLKWVYKWEIEEKVITVGMREAGEGAKYQSIAWIYNKPVFDRIGYNKSNVNKVRDAAKF